GLAGEARGRVRVQGTASGALAIAAGLTAALGRLTFSGTVDRAAGPRIAGSGTLRGIRLAALSGQLPEGSVSGDYVVDLTGSSAEELAGRVRFAVDTAHVASVPVRDALLVAWVEAGVARVDSLYLDAAGTLVTGAGEFGLV